MYVCFNLLVEKKKNKRIKQKKLKYCHNFQTYRRRRRCGRSCQTTTCCICTRTSRAPRPIHCATATDARSGARTSFGSRRRRRRRPERRRHRKCACRTPTRLSDCASSAVYSARSRYVCVVYLYVMYTRTSCTRSSCTRTSCTLASCTRTSCTRTLCTRTSCTRTFCTRTSCTCTSRTLKSVIVRVVVRSLRACVCRLGAVVAQRQRFDGCFLTARRRHRPYPNIKISSNTRKQFRHNCIILQHICVW